MNPDALKQLISSCRKSKERILGQPNDWCPRKVKNPDMPDGYYFSDESAWEFIAHKLESGHVYEMMTLHTPPGARAIVMEVPLQGYEKPLYIKVQIGVANKPVGRSFHISYR